MFAGAYDGFGLARQHAGRVRQIQNSVVRAALNAPKSCHITPILRSLHWLKITERIEYKLLSLSFKVLTKPSYLYSTSSPFNLPATLALYYL